MPLWQLLRGTPQAAGRYWPQECTALFPQTGQQRASNSSTEYKPPALKITSSASCTTSRTNPRHSEAAGHVVEQICTDAFFSSLDIHTSCRLRLDAIKNSYSKVNNHFHLALMMQLYTAYREASFNLLAPTREHERDSSTSSPGGHAPCTCVPYRPFDRVRCRGGHQRQKRRGARLEGFHRGWSARTPSSAICSNNGGGVDYVGLWRLTK